MPRVRGPLVTGRVQPAADLTLAAPEFGAAMTAELLGCVLGAIVVGAGEVEGAESAAFGVQEVEAILRHDDDHTRVR